MDTENKKRTQLVNNKIYSCRSWFSSDTRHVWCLASVNCENERQRAVGTDNLFGGKTTGFLDLSGKKFPTELLINTGGTGGVTGGIKYYYFSSSPPDDSLNSVVKIHKTLSRYNTGSGVWEPMTGNSSLQIGDKVKTILTINTSRQLNYVFINDRRAAAMEPHK